MNRDPRILIEEIMESIARIEEYTRGIERDEFFQEAWIQDAVIRRLEIIGEAVKNIPDDFRARDADIPWRQIAGMRDVLIHVCFGVNLERVWMVVVRDLPDLKSRISGILDELE